VPLRFQHQGVELVIDAPQGSQVEPGFITRIRRGPYLVQITSTRPDLARVKKHARESTLHPFLGEVLEEENLYAFKQRDYDGSVQYIFFYGVKLGDREFGVHNENFSPSPRTKEQLDWVKSLRVP